MHLNLNQCLLYMAGLYLTFALDDLSFNALATQSPIFPSSSSSHHYYKASNAIDRNTDTCMRTDAIAKGTSSPSKNTWWKVDLGAVYNIYSIDILFKYYGHLEEYRQRGRFAGFALFVSNNGDIKGSILCYKDGPELPPLNFTTTCTEYGRYVIFYNERMDEVVYPDSYQLTNVYTELCEVIVKGCKKHDVYGMGCDIPCPIACKNSICHIQNGACLECEHGVFGGYCNISCPLNCNDNKCDMQNGTCFTCKSGWTGIFCKIKCPDRWYGVNCSQQCSKHCSDGTTCNHVNGQCDKGCDPGWTGSFCNKECVNGTYGYNCVNNCSGHCLNNSLCNKHTGFCERGCNPGYTGAHCIKKCSPGTFGVNCRERCSGHCLNDKPCDQVSGMCTFGCQDGFTGKHCNKSCDTGTYGENCAFQCSQNCNGTCGYIDGSCTACKIGWKGYNCSEECVQSYGENCRYPCSLHCYNQTCDRFNGRCLQCCTDGFHGELCDKEPVRLNQNESHSNSFVIPFILSLIVNFVLISGGCLLCRGISAKNVSISRDLLSCSKTSIYYTDTEVKADENSTYEELDLTREDSPYKNTTIQ